MANMGDLKVEVEVGLTIPDSTVKKCLSILEMWLNDNPNKQLQMECRMLDTGKEERTLSVIDRF